MKSVEEIKKRIMELEAEKKRYEKMRDKGYEKQVPDMIDIAEEELMKINFELKILRWVLEEEV